ncbi:MAG TPA: hypothetical protein DEG17_15605 [Cyanobacteria bacterium UBA11149]|nr:hypothetical protein [Cyanobacteria bacterium UBA11367]HBE59167.1 hypothetical protein [Cyanobacteria bacterium UBA11366]HBK64984.1 hypothetical protein [Cyanobacteria bacterium UBA11166]HBR72731.1 hypothetical protein [Cyanobacteria bacterium UBA11159]HBS69204.1 hypothetical protein [Cyanobacteria bacterium UBA11153]HBW90257.1 hypothetical protein [Cyanobacteria bacterium UBA11149]HCA94093.1 hypothetical protein [Cyanobacteria bacterium UBA9226]
METLVYIDLTLASEAPTSATPIIAAENLNDCDRRFNRQTLSRYGRRYLPSLFVLLSMFPMAGEAFVQILQEGSQGPLVTQLQERLLALDYFHQEPTGYFGSKTKDAVMRFQGKYGINRDGIVGKVTWNALFGDSSLDQNLSSYPNSLPPATTYSTPFKSKPRDRNYVPVTTELDYPPTFTREYDDSYSFSDYPDDDPHFTNSIPIPSLPTLDEETVPQSSLGNYPPPKGIAKFHPGRLLQRGSRGEDVQQLQYALREHGFNPGSTNGIYGEDTENAVMEFQKFHHFQVDGVAGNEILTALGLSGNFTDNPTPWRGWGSGE